MTIPFYDRRSLFPKPSPPLKIVTSPFINKGVIIPRSKLKEVKLDDHHFEVEDLHMPVVATRAFESQLG